MVKGFESRDSLKQKDRKKKFTEYLLFSQAALKSF